MSRYQMPDQGWLRQIFHRIDADRSGTIEANELQAALSNGTWRPFNINTCQLMISLFDGRGEGKITFDEFVRLWQYVTHWVNCFNSVDTDGSGNIDIRELQACFHSMGYRLSNSFYQHAMRKYDRSNQNALNFDDFIHVCCVLQMLTKAFRQYDTDRDGWIQISYEQFLVMVMNVLPA